MNSSLAPIFEYNLIACVITVFMGMVLMRRLRATYKATVSSRQEAERRAQLAERTRMQTLYEMIETMSQDYIRTARAKGLTERVTLYKHALRNAILPFVTIIGLDIPFLMGGALVTESVFSWPGMGRLFWEYAERGDYPVVLGVLLLTSTGVVFFTIIVDLLYTVVDPRIRLS